MFKPEQIDAWKIKHPDGIVISHPEASFEVCQKSDHVGSTEFILTTIRKAEPNTNWLVATELNLVNRVAEEMKPKGVEVEFMSNTVCMCATMFRTDPQHLCWVLENLVAGNVVNQIKVKPEEALQAKLAINNMLEVSEATGKV